MIIIWKIIFNVLTRFLIANYKQFFLPFIFNIFLQKLTLIDSRYYNYIKLTLNAPPISRNRTTSPCRDIVHFVSTDCLPAHQFFFKATGACYRIKTRFVHPPSLKSLKNTAWRGQRCGSWRAKSKIPETGSPRLCPPLPSPPPRTDKGRCSPRFSHFAHVSAVSQPASPETLF